jgi:hypothetical protein
VKKQGMRLPPTPPTPSAIIRGFVSITSYHLVIQSNKSVPGFGVYKPIP